MKFKLHLPIKFVPNHWLIKFELTNGFHTGFHRFQKLDGGRYVVEQNESDTNTLGPRVRIVSPDCLVIVQQEASELVQLLQEIVYDEEMAASVNATEASTT